MANTPAGWLIIESGGQEAACCELRVGKNRIGRVSRLCRPDVAVTGDEYMSRNHAILVVRISSRNVYEYLLADSARAMGRPSTNGTFVNGSTSRLGEDPVRLQPGDKFRCGNTEFTLKAADIQVDVEGGVRLQQRLGEEPAPQAMAPGVVLRRKV